MFYNGKELELLTHKNIEAPVLSRKKRLVFYTNDCEQTPNSVNWNLSAPKQYRNDEVGRLCKKYGAEKVEVYTSKDKEPEELEVPECKTDVYYNGLLNQYILMYRITKNEQYISRIAEQKFLIPVQIEKSKDKKNSYPEIKYLSASKNHANRLHVLFSDHEEYSKWKKATNTPGFNDLILIDAAKLYNLDKAHGGNRAYDIYLNPCGNKLILRGQARKLFYSKISKKK